MSTVESLTIEVNALKVMYASFFDKFENMVVANRELAQTIAAIPLLIKDIREING
jgi:hypothetical protein